MGVGSAYAPSSGVLRDPGAPSFAILAFFFPGEIARIAAKGLGDVPEGPTVLTDALSSHFQLVQDLRPGIARERRDNDRHCDSHRRSGPDSSGDVGVYVRPALRGTTQSKRGADADHPPSGRRGDRVHRAEQPGVGVQSCRSGRRGAIWRRRSATRGTASFIFLSIVVGVLSGVQSLAVGAVVSIIFNFVCCCIRGIATTAGTCDADRGGAVVTPIASSRQN